MRHDYGFLDIVYVVECQLDLDQVDAVAADFYPCILTPQTFKAPIWMHTAEIASVKETQTTWRRISAEHSLGEIRATPIARGEIPALDDNFSDLADLNLFAH